MRRAGCDLPTMWPEPGPWRRPPRGERSIWAKAGASVQDAPPALFGTSFMYILLHSSWKGGFERPPTPDPSQRPSCRLPRPPEYCPGTPSLSGQALLQAKGLSRVASRLLLPEGTRLDPPRPSAAPGGGSFSVGDREEVARAPPARWSQVQVWTRRAAPDLCSCTWAAAGPRQLGDSERDTAAPRAARPISHSGRGGGTGQSFARQGARPCEHGSTLKILASQGCVAVIRQCCP